MTSFAQNGLLLDVQHVTMRFGGITAVNDLSMRIPTGSITGLIGPNGAGKTTAFNVISGFYNPQEGDILFKGHSVKGFPPHRICRAGMARTFQNIRLFGSETALENVMVGCQVRRKSQWWMPVFSLPSARREEEEIREKARSIPTWTKRRRACPTGRSGALKSPAPWRPARTSCSSTNPPPG